MKRRLAITALALVCAPLISCGEDPPAQVSHPAEEEPCTAAAITLDGRFDDWAEVPLACSDVSGDLGAGVVDMLELKLANDENWLYLMLTAAEPFMLDEENSLALLMDTHQPVEGVGAELTWVLGERTGLFVHDDPGDRTELSYTDLSFRAAPTVDAVRYEMAIDRRAVIDGVRLFPGFGFEMMFSDESGGIGLGDELPNREFGSMPYLFDATPVEPVAPIGLDKDAPSAIRLLTYNTLWGGLLDAGRQDAFRRVLVATDPDIIFLQEASSPGTLQARISQWLPLDGATWQVRGADDTIILSRLPLRIGWPDSTAPLASSFTVAAADLAPDRMLVLVDAHLSSGMHDSSRQRQVDSLMAYLRQLKEPGGSGEVPPGSPIVIAGDMNFVRLADQLNTLLTGAIADTATYGEPFAPDWDGSDLAQALPRHTHQRMTYTWRDDGDTWWPGRLDFVVYTDSALGVAKSYVLHTPSMAAEDAAAAGLLPDDTTTASDHLPVIVDFFVD